jgi:glucosamine 6-phosphate synthetase-like amidotransferase/phosphosugar isomerase protein
VQDRGATIIVISTVADFRKLIDTSRIAFVIELQPVKSMIAALQVCIPLQMISYYTSKAKGMNPDKQVFDAIDF